jgi:hypothetical protein
MTNTALDIGLARLVTGGNPELEKLVASYFSAGSPETLSEFLRNALASGTALLELFREHGGLFDTFVDDIVEGRYFWFGIGRIIGNLLRISALLVRTGPAIIGSVVAGMFGTDEDDSGNDIPDPDCCDLGFGPPSYYYTGEDSGTGFMDGYLERQRNIRSGDRDRF